MNNGSPHIRDVAEGSLFTQLMANKHRNWNTELSSQHILQASTEDTATATAPTIARMVITGKADIRIMD